MSDKIRYDSIVLGFLKPNYEDMERPYKASVSYPPKIVSNGSKGSSDPPPNRPNKYGMIIIVTMYVHVFRIGHLPLGRQLHLPPFSLPPIHLVKSLLPLLRCYTVRLRNPLSLHLQDPTHLDCHPLHPNRLYLLKDPELRFIERERERDTLYLIYDLSSPPLSLRLFTIILLNMMMKYHLLPDHLSF